MLFSAVINAASHLISASAMERALERGWITVEKRHDD
jgi:hypothetical protein